MIPSVTREDGKVKLAPQFIQVCIIGLLLGCGRPTTDQQPTTDQKPVSENRPASTSAIKASFENPTLKINDKELIFPCRLEDLTQALGPPDRTTKLIFTVSTWDKYGIIAYEGTIGSPISSIKFYFQKSGDKFCPKTTFSGTVEYGGKKIEQTSTQSDLIAAGLMRDSTIPFYYGKEDGKFTIIADYENERLNGMSIGR